jgi:hypothetical protein
MLNIVASSACRLIYIVWKMKEFLTVHIFKDFVSTNQKPVDKLKKDNFLAL